MKTLLVLIIAQILGGQSTIQLNQNPLKKDAAKLKELTTILDEEDGFYDRVLASFSAGEKLVVADVGNKTLHIYNNKFEEIKSFGKEGSGPGEIDNIFRLNTGNNRIYLRSFSRLMIFDFNGKHYKDINLFKNGSPEIIFFEDEIMFRYKSGKYKLIIYDKDGEIKRRVSDKNYVEEKNQNQKGMVFNFVGGSEILKPYKNGFMSGQKGEYILSIMNRNFSKVRTLKRNFEHVKRDFKNYKMSFKMEGASKKAQMKMQKKAQQMMRKQMGEYKNDIRFLLGTIKNYILVSTASDDDDQLNIDVISPDFKYYTVIHYKKDELLSAVIENEKLLVCLKNEDDGPYVKVFDVIIN